MLKGRYLEDQGLLVTLQPGQAYLVGVLPHGHVPIGLRKQRVVPEVRQKERGILCFLGGGGGRNSFRGKSVLERGPLDVLVLELV